MINWQPYFAELGKEIDRVNALVDYSQEPITVAITGGRDFDDQMLVYATLSMVDHFIPIGTFINGYAEGVDKLGVRWAMLNRKTTRSLPARWKSVGHAAGPARNSDMVEILLKAMPKALLVSFPGGSGTADMTAKCNLAGIPVIDVLELLDRVHE